ncbi:hypothetical protein HN51_021082 [Arachis hypogaea]|uniref:uncharacterized protein n=1 Tax=Arachis hypogaea TaxID=3818 RepID=UPI000DED05D1|nr:uncharacterized protein At5g41620 [Arachis hypogaea]QHO52012.1 uncharacterized protein DS421_2g35880 [Arachis hypogaea]
MERQRRTEAEEEEKGSENKKEQKVSSSVSMVEKLRESRSFLLKGGGGTCCTTPPPSWRLEEELPSSQSPSKNNPNANAFHHPLQDSSLSSRQLCATLWKIQSYNQQQTQVSRMNSPASIRIRRRRCRRRIRQLAQPPDTPFDQKSSASSLKRHVASTFVQQHRSVESDGCVEMEAAPYNPSLTRSNSTDFKGMIGESSYNVTTSKELVKILKRIWSLEEQHASNVSVMKALKTELYHSEALMKELLQEKKMNRKEIEDLMKRIKVEKLVRKDKVHERIKTAVKPVEEELDNERRLRKHSESLHRKLARELCEVKASFAGCLRNFERERKARILLENLCDEFAKGIRDYEQEVYSLRRNSEKCSEEEKGLDRLILHISEAWLDERMQMKLSESGNDFMERNSIVDKLGFDIETFLHAKRSIEFKKFGYSSPKELREIYPCQQHSLDSFPLKEDSSDTKFLEPKSANGKEEVGKVGSKMQDSNKTGLVVNDEAIEVAQESDNRPSWTLKMNSSSRSSNPAGNSSLSSENGAKIHPDESICKADSCAALNVDNNLVELLKSKLIVSDSELPIKFPKGVKENTLIAKLLEARLERQKSRSRYSRSSTC